tara:strand:- start:779 stop:1261 length:483 start_codon:yes stop_codon:yes gene_type:complete
MRYFILLAILSIVGFSYSQDLDHFVIGTDGGHVKNNQFSLSYTIGEVVSGLARDRLNNIDITQGFHQPNISIVSVEDHDFDVNITVFPNPAIDYINVKISDLERANRFYIYDISGRLLSQQQILEKAFKIGFSQLSTGNYIILFTKDDTKIKTIKVQKSH